MITKSFLKHGKTCPCCKQKLFLYAIVEGIGTFKCSNNFVSNKKNSFNFYPLKDDTFGLDPRVNKTDNFSFIIESNNGFSLSVHTENIFRLLLNSTINLFYICNLSSIVNDSFDIVNSYGIDMFNVCYYNYSNDLKFKIKDNVVSISQMHDSTSKIEIFSLNLDNESYCLYYDFNNEKTVFYYNESTTIFTKEFPLLDYYPDFSDRNKVSQKFKSWVLFS
jgi:hypothetical protein